jgi:hypothetical protein
MDRPGCARKHSRTAQIIGGSVISTALEAEDTADSSLPGARFVFRSRHSLLSRTIGRAGFDQETRGNPQAFAAVAVLAGGLIDTSMEFQ